MLRDNPGAVKKVSSLHQEKMIKNETSELLQI